MAKRNLACAMASAPALANSDAAVPTETSVTVPSTARTSTLSAPPARRPARRLRWVRRLAPRRVPRWRWVAALGGLLRDVAGVGAALLALRRVATQAAFDGLARGLEVLALGHGLLLHLTLARGLCGVGERLGQRALLTRLAVGAADDLDLGGLTHRRRGALGLRRVADRRLVLGVSLLGGLDDSTLDLLPAPGPRRRAVDPLDHLPGGVLEEARPGAVDETNGGADITELELPARRQALLAVGDRLVGAVADAVARHGQPSSPAASASIARSRSRRACVSGIPNRRAVVATGACSSVIASMVSPLAAGPPGAPAASTEIIGASTAVTIAATRCAKASVSS